MMVTCHHYVCSDCAVKNKGKIIISNLLILFRIISYLQRLFVNKESIAQKIIQEIARIVNEVWWRVIS
jgi:hypothetical protein